MIMLDCFAFSDIYYLFKIAAFWSFKKTGKKLVQSYRFSVLQLNRQVPGFFRLLDDLQFLIITDWIEGRFPVKPVEPAVPVFNTNVFHPLSDFIYDIKEVSIEK